MKKFEYITIKADTNLDTDYLDSELDSLVGEKGQELVTAASDNSINDDGETYTEYIWYTLKREVD